MTIANDHMRLCRHNEFEADPLGGTLGFFMIVTGKVGSSLRTCSETQEFVYYPALVQVTLTSTLQTQKEIVLLL